VRILAVDFGERRIGLATSDASGAIATPRLTIRRSADARALEQLRRFCAEEEIERVIFGIPRLADGTEAPFAARVRSFARKFEKACDLPVEFHEETRTSQEAQRRLPPGAAKEALDREAAAVLLEDYLEARATRKR
jgi:putative Holliday junction resolvase